jgi:hypothetical protein
MARMPPVLVMSVVPAGFPVSAVCCLIVHVVYLFPTISVQPRRFVMYEPLVTQCRTSEGGKRGSQTRNTSLAQLASSIVAT